MSFKICSSIACIAGIGIGLGIHSGVLAYKRSVLKETVKEREMILKLEESEKLEEERLNGLSTEALMGMMQAHNWTSPPPEAALNEKKLIKWYADTNCTLSPDGSHEMCSLIECMKVQSILFQRLARAKQ